MLYDVQFIDEAKYEMIVEANSKEEAQQKYEQNEYIRKDLIEGIHELMTHIAPSKQTMPSIQKDIAEQKPFDPENKPVPDNTNLYSVVFIEALKFVMTVEADSEDSAIEKYYNNDYLIKHLVNGVDENLVRIQKC